MKIICSTVVRAAKQGDIHGGLYVIDIDLGEVIHYAPYERDFVNDNERGGERGLRGICVLPDRILVADSAGFIELDKNTYEIKRTFQDREYFKSIHEIVFHDDHIWATSTAYDAIVKLDLDFNIKNFWEITGERREDYSVLTGKKEVTPETKSEDDNYHINSIFVNDGRILFSGLVTPLYDLETMTEVCQVPQFQDEFSQQLKSFSHNFYKFDEFTVSNLTSFGSLGILENDSDLFDLHKIPRTKKARFIVDEIASDNWNRGLARCGEKLIIGSSPARILIFNTTTKQFEQEIKLKEDIRHAVHGLEVLDEV